MVRLVRNQKNDTFPPPRRSDSPFASMVGHDESSKPVSPAWGVMSYEVLYPGMALRIAVPSTILASMVFHWAPNAPLPSAVIKSTTYDGTSAGGIFGSGGCGGACATATIALIMKITVSPAQAISLSAGILRISSSFLSG